jgi:2,3-bisphosphoglycerate-dependent phosphoglycerate mutase
VIRLVRHGESTWNAAGLLQGRTAHVGLTARGRAQARGAARRLAGFGGPILTSPQRRALQTATIIGSALGLPVTQCPELREQSHGEWEGRAVAELPPWPDDPDWAPPGGETARALHARAAGFLAGLEGPAVLVTHGETIRALLAAAAGLPAGAMPRDVPANGAVVACFPGARVMSSGVDGSAGIRCESGAVPPL